MTISKWLGAAAATLFVLHAPLSMGQDQAPVFKIKDHVYTLGEVKKTDESTFYDIESKKYEAVEQLAKTAYLESFFEKLARDSKKSKEQARTEYLAKNAKVTDADVKATLDQFKDNPQLKSLPKEEQDKQIRQYLAQKGEQEVTGRIIDQGLTSGDLQVLLPRPAEPVYDVKLTGKEPVRYGSDPSDTSPKGCAGDACAITIVEYSEFQCPFCSRSQPAAKQALDEYKGRIRWITKDFPLSFHDRAKPAAVAAHCAGDQGKFWHMYVKLFENQDALSDADLAKHADAIKLDKAKWTACIKKPAEKEKIIDESMESGVKLGVSGTPAFFINGRRLTGAVPYTEFKRIIEEELKKGKRPS